MSWGQSQWGQISWWYTLPTPASGEAPIEDIQENNIKFPFIFTGTCNLELDNELTIVGQSMVNACLTVFPTLLDISSDIPELVFDPNDRPTQAIARNRIRNAISRGVNNVIIKEIFFTELENQLSINILFVYTRNNLTNQLVLNIPKGNM